MDSTVRRHTNAPSEVPDTIRAWDSYTCTLMCVTGAVTMRELRGAKVVSVSHIPGESNPADLFTKILSRQPFEKHSKVVLNLPGGNGIERVRAAAAWHVSSLRDGTDTP